MSKNRTFESLLSQNYSSVILTIDCIGVGSYKIFNSHAPGGGVLPIRPVRGGSARKGYLFQDSGI